MILCFVYRPVARSPLALYTQLVSLFIDMRLHTSCGGLQSRLLCSYMEAYKVLLGEGLKEIELTHW
jgi:hypothetical protein